MGPSIENPLLPLFYLPVFTHPSRLSSHAISPIAFIYSFTQKCNNYMLDTEDTKLNSIKIYTSKFSLQCSYIF